MVQPQPNKTKTKEALLEREEQLSKIARRFDRLDVLLDEIETRLDSEEIQQITARKPK